MKTASIDTNLLHTAAMAGVAFGLAPCGLVVLAGSLPAAMPRRH
jgi:sulfite exporter TauE/SafE